MPAARPATLLVSVLVALSSAGCALTGTVTSARSWTQAASGVDGRDHVTNVNDRSGRVQDVEVDSLGGQAGGGVVAVPGQPNALDVPWVGGACDTQTDVDIADAGAGLVVTVKITRDESNPCPAVGVLRSIRLHLDKPLAPALVDVRQ